jgi:FkbH-like protein
LKKRGVLLALNSRNNWDDVAQVFQEHPDMILGLKDFSAVRVNWADKVSNIREIAAELNIGVDSIVFMDDSPFECELVRHTLPEVTVVQVPPDPAFYPELVRSLPWFQRPGLSEEDLRRAEMMAEEEKRHRFLEAAGSYEEFLCSLEMVAEFSSLSEGNLPRAAQLTQKTNQFNLTTRRYGKSDLAALTVGGRYLGLVVRLRDRFGDSGLVGFALVEMGEGFWRIDTFLLSCRVLGRGLETTMLSQIARLAQQRAVPRLVGEFIATGKNQPAAAFFRDHGFNSTGSDGLWELDLTVSRVDSPPWIAVKGDLQ